MPKTAKLSKDFSPKTANILFWAVSLFILVLTILPFIYGWMITPEGMQFLGRRSVNSPDTYPVLSLIAQAKEGKLIFENLYADSTQKLFIYSPLYLILGNIGRFVSIPNIILFHAGRLVLGFMFLILLYKFLHLFFDKRGKILAAFIFVSLSSGLGFFIYRSLPASYDLFLPQSNVFLSLLESPEVIFQEILLIIMLGIILNFTKSRKIGLPKILLFTTSFLLLVPNILFNLPKQMITAEVLPLLSSVGFCLPVVFYVYKKSQLHQSLKLAVVFALFFFIPTPLQRLSLFGFYLFISISAFVEYCRIYDEYLLPVISRKKFLMVLSSVVVFLVLFVLFPATNYFHLYWDMRNFQKDKIDNYNNYLLKEEFSAISWLKSNTPVNSVVLAKPFYGNIIGGLTGRKMFPGGGEDNTAKLNDISGFLNSWPDITRIQYLKDNHINYLFFGKNDSMLLGTFKPEKSDYLGKIYSQGAVTIYKFSI